PTPWPDILRHEVGFWLHPGESRLRPGRRLQIQGDSPIAMMIDCVTREYLPANAKSQSPMRDEILRLWQVGHDIAHRIVDGPLSFCHRLSPSNARFDRDKLSGGLLLSRCKNWIVLSRLWMGCKKSRTKPSNFGGFNVSTRTCIGRAEVRCKCPV